MTHFPPGKIIYHSPQGALTLRPLRIEDTPSIYLARKMSEPSLHRFLAWSHQPCTLEAQHAFVARTIANFYLNETTINFGFFDSQEHFIGMGGLIRSRHNPNSYEIGYWISMPYQNKGYATLVTKLLILTSFTWMEASRLGIVALTNNRASQRVIEKCGFSYEGLVRNFENAPTPEMLANGFEPGTDAIRYSMLPGEMQLQPWYEDILNHSEIIPLYPELSHPHPLPHTRALSSL